MVTLLACDRVDRFFPLAIESILNQDYDDHLLMVIDNSGDRTVSRYVAHRYSVNKLRVVAASLHQLSFALNVGIHLSSSPYIARMDADDIAEPGRLRAQARFLDENPHIDVVGGQYVEIDESGTELSRSRLPLEPDGVRRAQFWEGALCHPAVMMRRSALLRVDGYIGARRAQDLDLWLRMRRHSIKMANLADFVLRYRRHAAQETSWGNRRELIAETAAMFVRELLISGDPRFFYGITYNIGRLASLWPPARRLAAAWRRLSDARSSTPKSDESGGEGRPQDR